MPQPSAIMLVVALLLECNVIAAAWLHGVKEWPLIHSSHSREVARPLGKAPVLPGRVQLHSCVQEGDALDVSWSPSSDAPVDFYELQVSAAAGGSTVVAFTTGKHEAHLDALLHGVSYWVRARAHLAGIAGFGPGYWGEVGPELACTLNSTGKKGAVSKAPGIHSLSQGASDIDTFFLDVLRGSEYTTELDYLTNHDSGDVLGTVTLMSALATAFNESRENITLAMYCVEVLKTTIPGTVTTGGNTSFADYVSCNFNPVPWKIDPSHPVCECENFVDRLIGGQDVNRYCHAPAGGPCDLSHFNLSECICDCDAASTANSKRFMGMQPISWTTSANLGRWYSHPLDGECGEDEQVGQPNGQSGLPCTWKRHPEVRVLRIGDLLDHGWNTTLPPPGSFTALPAVDRQNEAAYWKAFSKLPLKPWTCGKASDVQSNADLNGPRSHILI